MKNNINEFCTQFIINRDVLKKAVRFESSFFYPTAANKLTAAGVVVDEDEFKECKKILKKSISSISYLRGHSELTILTEMYLSGDPQGAAERIVETYSILKKHFSSSEYLAFLAILLGNNADAKQSEEIGTRARRLYDMMKKKHPILTNSADSTMSGFMALSDKSDEQLIEDCEECFNILKKTFSDKDAVQSCAQLFSITEGDNSEKADKMTELYDTLKEAGRKFDKHYGLPVLAAVSICDRDVKTIADTMLEADAFLSKQKGYGALSTDKRTRLLHAAMLTLSFYCGSENSQAATLAMMAAQQAAECAMIACIAASSAAAASSN
ncbi:MAG: DUF4003 family protein [Ruminococcus sp.]|uniref:DUF4003 family protein n=1 Tax=Ruminococcus sp. TaxID=41978 RepID=UPI0025DD1F87|nr:DUF4003 family protein [Ruminococcus sp.]MBO4866141.1 DUF4003 family protein [Ruminococcus sp.]